MKCISLSQPWAMLVVLGAKQHETRGWRTTHRGLLAIHATRSFPQRHRNQCQLEPFRTVLRLAGIRHSADLPCGVIVGTVDLVDCLPVNQVLAELEAASAERAFGDFRPGRWAWKLANPSCLAEPIPCTGRLGLFDVPDLAAVLRSV